MRIQIRNAITVIMCKYINTYTCVVRPAYNSDLLYQSHRLSCAKRNALLFGIFCNYISQVKHHVLQIYGNFNKCSLFRTEYSKLITEAEPEYKPKLARTLKFISHDTTIINDFFDNRVAYLKVLQNITSETSAPKKQVASQYLKIMKDPLFTLQLLFLRVSLVSFDVTKT